MKIVIDGTRIKTKESVHEYFLRYLSVDNEYGYNLDALYDLLTDISEETEIEIKNCSTMRKNLPGYANQILCVLRDANEENECLSVVLD